MHIVLDFDGTITANDTIGHLAEAAVAFQTARDTQAGRSTTDWGVQWKRIVDDYMTDHARHAADYTPAEPDRTGLQQELAFLDSLRDVDGGSIRALAAAGLFRGMAAQHLADAAQAAVHTGGRGGVRVRPGFAEFVAAASRHAWPVSIVSVNWSDAWIRGVVATQAARTSEIKVYTNTISDAGAIVANYERAATADSSSTDPISSCRDKLEALRVATDAADAPVVYMGDSTTDLACLLHAAQGRRGGGGIVLADGNGSSTSKLLRALVRLGYSVPHVSEAGPGRFRATDTDDSTPRLAWARDFDEIMASQIVDGLVQ